MMHRLAVLTLGLLIIAPAPTVASAVELHLDFSGIEAFWDIARTLERDEPPTAGQWEALLASPGYQALTLSEFRPEFFREAFTLALAPSRAEERALLEDGKLARIVQHVRRVSEREPGAASLGLGAARSSAGRGDHTRLRLRTRFLEGGQAGDRLRDLRLRRTGLRSDRLSTCWRRWSSTWARFWLTKAITGSAIATWPSMPSSRLPTTRALLGVVNQLQAEGIADRIDKVRWLTGEAKPPASRAGYLDQYRANLAAAPDHIRQLDALLRESASGGALPDGFADSLRQSIPQSGHPTGYFMAERIARVHGEEALIASAGDPFAFVELYQEAALADPALAPAVFRVEPGGAPGPRKSRDAARQENGRRSRGYRGGARQPGRRAGEGVSLRLALGLVDPPERIQELLGYAEWQHRLGGGFHGLLPDPLDGVEALPGPGDETTILEAALVLARRRSVNRAAVGEALATFPFRFLGDAIRDKDAAAPAGWSLSLDHSAIGGFVDARSDGEITIEEARTLASLPSNRQMLRHRRDLGYVPEPLPTEENLAEMIARAGSTDPLDRLWAWLHPWNFFGYADVGTEAGGYKAFMAELREHDDLLTDSVLSRVAAHAPEQTRVPRRLRPDHRLFDTGLGHHGNAGAQRRPGERRLGVSAPGDGFTRPTTRSSHSSARLLPARLPSISKDLATADLGDPGLEKLYEILAYAVLEGTAQFRRRSRWKRRFPGQRPGGDPSSSPSLCGGSWTVESWKPPRS